MSRLCDSQWNCISESFIDCSNWTLFLSVIFYISYLPPVHCARHYLDAQPTVSVLRQLVDPLVAEPEAAVTGIAEAVPVLGPAAVEVHRSVDSLMNDDPSLDRHQWNCFVECWHGDLNGGVHCQIV